MRAQSQTRPWENAARCSSHENTARRGILSAEAVRGGKRERWRGTLRASPPMKLQAVESTADLPGQAWQAGPPGVACRRQCALESSAVNYTPPAPLLGRAM